MIGEVVKNTNNETEWIPNVPEHWPIIRIKNLFYEIDQRSRTGKEDLLSVSQYTGVTLRKDSFEDGKEITNAKTLKGYKIVEQGDLVVNIMLAWNGSLGISRYKGITSPAYCVYRVNDNNNPEYFGYLFSTSLYKSEFRKRSTGIIESRLRLYSDEFFRIFCFVPPRDEQDKIVGIINTESAKITHFIQTKQRFIELLKEQRQSIITNAVTKGIDERAKMKETVLGEIPEHWEVRRLKNIGNVVLGKMLCNEDKGSYSYKPYLKSKNIGWEKAIVQEIENMWFSPNELITYRIKKNDLLVSEGGEVGKTCIWRNEIEECYIQNSVHKITCFNDCYPEFYLFYLGALGALGYFNAMVNQVSIAHLTREKLVTVKCVHPPIEEQKRIVEHIKTETRTLDIAISKAAREIELIKEYREAMIAEAVTGRVKVY